MFISRKRLDTLISRVNALEGTTRNLQVYINDINGSLKGTPPDALWGFPGMIGLTEKVNALVEHFKLSLKLRVLSAKREVKVEKVQKVGSNRP